MGTEIGPGNTTTTTAIDVLQKSTTVFDYNVTPAWLLYEFTASKSGAVRIDALLSSANDGAQDFVNYHPYVVLQIVGGRGQTAGESGSPNDIYVQVQAGDVLNIQILGVGDLTVSPYPPANLVVRVSDWATVVTPAHTPAPVTVRPTSIAFQGVPAIYQSQYPAGSITGTNPGAVTDGSDATYSASSYQDSTNFHFEPTSQIPVSAYATIRASVNPFLANQHNLVVSTYGGTAEAGYNPQIMLSSTPTTYDNLSLRKYDGSTNYSQYTNTGPVVGVAFGSAAPDGTGYYPEMIRVYDVSITMQMPDVPAVYHADLWSAAAPVGGWALNSIPMH